MVLKFQNGAAVVPLRELRVTESSESVLAGTKRPPFRLVVRAIKPDGRRLNIRPAVSEEFVVRASSPLQAHCRCKRPCCGLRDLLGRNLVGLSGCCASSCPA